MSRRFGSPTPYGDVEGQRRKQKRFLSRSDEEIRSEMDLGLSYRAGWPTLQPFPLETVATDTRVYIPDEPQRLEDVQSILAAQDLLITGTSYFFAYRIPRDAAEEDDMSAYLTLLVRMDMVNHFHKVVNTVMRIRTQFRDHASTANMQIECLDYRVGCSLASFAIGHTEVEIHKQWSNALPIILSSLDDHDWLTVEMLRRGLRDEDSKNCLPTIVITTPTARDPRWHATVVPMILANISKTAPLFVIEILLGVSVVQGRRQYSATGAIDSTSYVKNLHMGSSLGISNNDGGCGTLGGSVTLDGGIRCGITNWHCVRDERLDNGIDASFLNDAQADPNVVVSKNSSGALGVGNKTLEAAPQDMLSPATPDHEGHLGMLQLELKELSAQAADGVAYAKTSHKEKDEEYEKCEKYARGIGYVYAGSGRRCIIANKYATEEETGRSKERRKHMETTYAFPLDWALIRLDIDKRDIINYLPETKRPLHCTSDLVPGKRCHRWTTFNVNKEDVQVAKYGRTSRWTYGKINGCLIAINPKCETEISGVYGFSVESPGWCFGVVNTRAMEDFFEPGDSGSILVHDGSGTQLGLLFGVTSGGQGMAMPLDLVFRDIKKITRKAVTDPPYVGKLRFAPNEMI
jgi:hypothetical protein